jgi:TetR/AcrR family transcriptional regulator, cholesterol catabolism regulator
MVAKPTKRDEIYKTAAEIFRARGFADTSIQDIAEVLGMPKASAYYHIGSKEELFFEILMTGVTGLVQRLETIAAYPISALDRLRLAVRDNMRSALEEVHGPLALMSRDMHVLSPEHRAEYRKLQRRYEDAFMSILEAGMANGEMRQLPNPKIAMFGYLHMLGNFGRWYRLDGPLTREDCEAIYWDVILHSLRPENDARPN